MGRKQQQIEKQIDLQIEQQLKTNSTIPTASAGNISEKSITTAEEDADEREAQYLDPIGRLGLHASELRLMHPTTRCVLNP